MKQRTFWLSCAVVFALITALFLLSGCMSDEYEDNQAKKKANFEQRLTNHVAENLLYFKDTRTDLCFAYIYETRRSGIATVPCGSVPDDLLIYSEVP